MEEKLRMGEKLKNGATLIAKDGERVLCMWRKEYIIWTIDKEGNTFWGHYFPETAWKEAFKEFLKE